MMTIKRLAQIRYRLNSPSSMIGHITLYRDAKLLLEAYDDTMAHLRKMDEQIRRVHAASSDLKFTHSRPFVLNDAEMGESGQSFGDGYSQ